MFDRIDLDSGLKAEGSYDWMMMESQMKFHVEHGIGY